MEDYHPRTNVAFAATAPFQRRWQDEAKAQMQKFTESSWALNTDPEPRPPSPVPQDEMVEIERNDRDTLIAGALIGCLFFITVAGIGYCLYKCLAAK